MSVEPHFCSSNTSQPGRSASSSPSASIMRKKWRKSSNPATIDSRSLGLKAVAKAGLCCSPPFIQSFFGTLERLTDQVLLVKCQDFEWNRETAVGIVFVPHIAVRTFAFARFRQSLEPPSGLQNPACPRPRFQGLNGRLDLGLR